MAKTIEARTATIGPDNNVDEILTRFPQTARVFVNHRMHCVGCEVARFETLAEACEIYHKPLQPLLDDLRRVVEDRG